MMGTQASMEEAKTGTGPLLPETAAVSFASRKNKQSANLC